MSGQSGNADVMVVQAGVPFDVKLGSGPSTGYIWELSSLPEGVLLSGSDYVEASPATIGGGGVQIFHLTTQRPGRFNLLFVRKRRWEKEPIETRQIVVDSR
jgi:predicted secreted protein